jgi:hypothetical protein
LDWRITPPMKRVFSLRRFAIRRFVPGEPNHELVGTEQPSDTEVPKPLQKPIEPDNCCGNQCVHCVWEVYFEDLKKYEEALEESEKKRLENTTKPV